MRMVLSELSSVPGVIGSLACDMEGRVLAHAFPPLFDTALLEGAVKVISDSAAGLELANRGVKQLDFHFGEAHLSVTPFSGAMLIVLAGKGTNAQFLNPSISLAAAKLEKLQAAPAGAAGQSADRGAVLPSTPGEAGEDPGLKKRVAAPAKGLEELRRRLAGGEEKRGGDSVRPSGGLPGNPGGSGHGGDPKRTKA